MSPLALFYAIAAAFVWANAVIVMRFFSGAAPSLMPMIVASGSMIACLPTLWFVKAGDFRWRAVLIGICGALLNGTGMVIAWRGLVGGASRGQWDLSIVMSITYVLLPMFIVLESFLIFHQRFSTNQSIGFVLGITSIWFLYQK